MTDWRDDWQYYRGEAAKQKLIALIHDDRTIGYGLQLKQRDLHTNSEPAADTYELVLNRAMPKPKRYVLPMEGTNDGATQAYVCYLPLLKLWDVIRGCAFQPNNNSHCQVEFTQADIDAAPKWVRDLEKVEVSQ